MSEIVLTGCDKNTEWQLPWFLYNLRKHNPKVIVAIANFGMSEEMLASVSNEIIFEVNINNGWYKKPEAMIQAGRLYGEKVLWMDTDCEVRGDITPVFNMIEPEMLLIAVDRPLNKRQPGSGCWHNSGVVGFTGVPPVLTRWAKLCEMPTQRGDQEELHHMFRGNDILKSQYIKPLPHTYNTLRIDIVDGVADPNPIVMHWTGRKGNEVIREHLSHMG